jgi:1-acyl-sn-glycerol-3-phosphate acyltransferase
MYNCNGEDSYFMKEKTYYYTDEVNEDFAGVSRREIIVDEKFKYVNHNPIYVFFEIILHRIIITPVAYFVKWFHFHQHVIGKKKLRGYKGQYILYGNHTQIPGDGFLPPTMTFWRKPFFVVSPANIAAKGTKTFIMMLGGIPTPTNLRGLRKFEEGLADRIKHHHPIIVYPEAHIWPYYTKIRNFKSTSFKYPSKFEVPAFCFTNTYQKRKFGKKAKMTTYIDGPFYPNNELSGKAREQELRDRIYNTMVERAKNSTYEYKYHYIKKESQDE